VLNRQWKIDPVPEPMEASQVSERYLVDFSLALINRTGAYFVGRDIVEELSHRFDQVRYWRLFPSSAPRGMLRKILGRMMLGELRKFRSTNWGWPEGRKHGRLPTLFLDPLYVLRSNLKKNDIVLCHDTGPITHADLFGEEVHSLYREAYDKIRRVGPGIVFISKASKDSFECLYGREFRFLHVISLYVRSALINGYVSPVAGITRPFLLTVGGFERRKNLLRTIDAYQSSQLYPKEIDYVLCGPKGNEYELVLQKAKATDGVTVLPYVSESELRWLYKEASGFLLPSLLEGFGVPALEAANAGLVPLVSRGAAQEEALGGNGIFVDPESVSSIARGIIKLINLSDAQKSVLVSKLQAHAARLTLERFLKEWESLLAANRPLSKAITKKKLMVSSKRPEPDGLR
jgi:glycosyltransferase involved in cell wall biosynthesis